MQKGSLLEFRSTSSSGTRTQRSKWMAMDAKQTTLIIGECLYQYQQYSCSVNAATEHYVHVHACLADAGPNRDQVEHVVALSEITEVRLNFRPGSSRTSSVWSFELMLASSHGSGRLYDISASQDRLVLECVASSDAFTEMWVVGLRLCLAEDRGMQFSQVRYVCPQQHVCLRSS